MDAGGNHRGNGRVKPPGWTFAVRSREYPQELTLACGNGKAMWTRIPAEIRWFGTSVHAEVAMLEAQQKCAQQAWCAKSEWVILSEENAHRALAALATASVY